MRRITSAIITGFPSGFLVGLLGALLLQHPLHLALLEAAGCGLVLGALFTTRAAAAVTSRRARGSIAPDLLPGERILKEGPATHATETTSVGGLLLLTNFRVIFRPYAPDTRAVELSVPLNQLARAQAVMLAWMHATGLHLQTGTGEVERFVVPEREQDAWACAITTAAEKHRGG